MSAFQTPCRTSESSARVQAKLGELLSELRARDYAFVTTTPATHARVIAKRKSVKAGSLRDIFGWSLPFDPEMLDARLLALLDQAGGLRRAGEDGFRSAYRVSSLGRNLYLHSAYPTLDEHAVFFGPDSYRFAALIADELQRHPVSRGGRTVDIGAGAGVGAIVAAEVVQHAVLTLTDIDAEALRLAAVNLQAAGVSADLVETSVLDGVDGPIDLALANPPYIIDRAGRDYRDGGGMHGGEATLEMVGETLPRLTDGGRMILYTGSAIDAFRDPLRQALAELAAGSGCRMRYDEIDPDVFGEELEGEAYRDVERIAAVGAIFEKATQGN